MFDWRIGLAVVVVLVLIPVAMVVRLAISLIQAWRDAREEERHKTTHVVPGLGEFTSTDGELWFGEVDDIQVSLTTQGRPPSEAQAGNVQRLLKQLPELAEQSRKYLLAHEDCQWLEGGAELFEPFGLDVEDDLNFMLELGHPSDDDGIYRVEFQSGLPVSSGRDD